VAELIEKLGRPGAPLAEGLVQRVGELCAGAEDAEDAAGAADDDGGARDQVLVAAQSALGAAMRALGPEVVLAALPLNLIQVTTDDCWV
jgi:ribosomal RNA-processing protein 12